MNNRKRANGITLGIAAIAMGILLMLLAFPKTMIASIISIGLLIGMYHVTKAIRDMVEDHLDEEDKNNKWKQDKNIK
jgi:uncharacterized membrane protein YjjP (DUF1212 family)